MKDTFMRKMTAVPSIRRVPYKRGIYTWNEPEMGPAPPPPPQPPPPQRCLSSHCWRLLLYLEIHMIGRDIILFTLSASSRWIGEYHDMTKRERETPPCSVHAPNVSSVVRQHV